MDELFNGTESPDAITRRLFFALQHAGYSPLLLVDKEDPATLARAVAHLLEDPGTAERMGQAARRRARELFGFERQVDAYDGLYQRLAEEVTHAGNT